MLWVGASFVLLMISASLVYALGFLDSKELLEFTPAVGCLVLSWLGASVFGSDARHGRIRFLAERGIAPTKIWWTRLALPFVGAILGVFAFLLPIQVWNFLHESHSRELRLNWTLDGQLMLRVLMIFGFAQWLPMWTRSTLIAICVSPVVAIFAILYIEFLQVFIASPWWLLVISIGLLFVATRVMLCPWMDGRRGLKYWLAQSALLIGVLILPLVPFLITYATYSDMPAALRRELTEEAKLYEPYRREVELVMPAIQESDAVDKTKDNSVGFGDSISNSIVSLERSLKSFSGPITNSHSMRTVIKEAELMSLRMRIDGEKPADSQRHFRERYRRSLVLLSNFAIRMRLSDRLIDQEVADQIERWLVDELLQPGRKEYFSDEEYSMMVTALADQSGRYEARRRAVVLAWYRYDGQNQQYFGGLDIPEIQIASLTTSWLVAERHVGQITAALLEYLESQPTDSDRLPPNIQAFWPRMDAKTERQIKIVDVDVIGTNASNALRIPGVLWHQDWEVQAAKLQESMK